ncbi:WecB/TagA/CpsF family glycosyltransferase [Corynebacterium pelargi]|uniref:UDP-N-acetyl-D-mannosaminuronic acid transferase n=1 Tax=Corynebacterium pelargi TaxID=1471400 RepID=A0A410W6C2_9CORY|nr:WecB/TagA/CpsF family glycosyltransferase [Corynebacterium pelargi]QAU51387.1 UDP-N-acetyl-D-mannosaminuronic acid transferase [Corynebacterium pelargi]GGG81275.1 teichoic acid biosynthesis glycosyltransferase [Corynebacterium pelargi]
MHIPTISVDSSGHHAELDGQTLFRGSVEDALDTFLGKAPACAQLLITPNVDQVNRLITDAQWRATFRSGDFYLIDGAPVLGLLKLLGAKGFHRVTGADLLPTAAKRATKEHTIVILGGKDEVREAAIEQLRAQNPDARFEGISIPFQATPEANEDIAEQLAALAPQLVFICLGSPKQEQWFQANQEHLPPAFYVGAGAAVDFAAGAVNRAPKLMQKLGLEWFYRLLQEPRRLAKRYLVVGPMFILVVIASLLRK